MKLSRRGRRGRNPPQVEEKKYLTKPERDGKIKTLQPQGGTLKIEQHSKRIETTLEIRKEFHQAGNSRTKRKLDVRNQLGQTSFD